MTDGACGNDSAGHGSAAGSNGIGDSACNVFHIEETSVGTSEWSGANAIDEIP